MRKTLPPFTMLLAFEAAARLLSFTRAGQELNVSQPAVSRQVRDLERLLGLTLFKRGHRSIELTAAGLALSKTMSRSLSDIVQTVSELTAPEKQEELVIAALPAFSTLWLTPRLHLFSSLHPHLAVRVISQDRTVNLNHAGIDIALRFGDGNWSDGKATRLYYDQLFPVCSPAYAAQSGEAHDLASLGDHRLIAYDRVETDWMSWDEWLAAFDYDGPPVTVRARYSNYPDAILATLDGQGIVIGWQALVRPYLKDGKLLRLGTCQLRTASAHYAVTSRHAATNPYAAAFTEWLREMTAGEG